MQMIIFKVMVNLQNATRISLKDNFNVKSKEEGLSLQNKPS